MASIDKRALELVAPDHVTISTVLFWVTLDGVRRRDLLAMRTHLVTAAVCGPAGLRQALLWAGLGRSAAAPRE